MMKFHSIMGKRKNSIDAGIKKIISDGFAKNKKYDSYDLDDRRLVIRHNPAPINFKQQNILFKDKYFGRNNYHNMSISEDDMSKNRERVTNYDGKLIINKAPGQKFPSINAIGKVYDKIPDDKKVPVVLETKKQYLKEYISNQEKKRNIKFSAEEKKEYVRNELKKLKPVSSRFTTYHNKYMQPRVVIFPGVKDTQVKNEILHEYGHELQENDSSLNKEWNKKINPKTSPTLYGTTDKEEDFAETLALYKNPSAQKINNPRTSPEEIKKRFSILDKHIDRDSSSRNMISDYFSAEEQFKQQNISDENNIQHKVFGISRDDVIFPDMSVNYVGPYAGQNDNMGFYGNLSRNQKGGTAYSTPPMKKRNVPPSPYPDRMSRNMTMVFPTKHNYDTQFVTRGQSKFADQNVRLASPEERQQVRVFMQNNPSVKDYVNKNPNPVYTYISDKPTEWGTFYRHDDGQDYVSLSKDMFKLPEEQQGSILKHELADHPEQLDIAGNRDVDEDKTRLIGESRGHYLQYPEMDVTKNFIRKLPNQNRWRTFSESGRNMGTFPSHGLAERRISQIEYFKNRGK